VYTDNSEEVEGTGLLLRIRPLCHVANNLRIRSVLTCRLQSSSLTSHNRRRFVARDKFSMTPVVLTGKSYQAYYVLGNSPSHLPETS